jgi:hypothetical protein
MFSEHDDEYDDASDVEFADDDKEMGDTVEEDVGEGQVRARYARAADKNKEVELEALEEEVNIQPRARQECHGHSEKLNRTPPVRIDTEQAEIKLIAGLLSPPAPDPEENSEARKEDDIGVTTGTELSETAATHQTPTTRHRVQQLAQSENGSQISPIKRVTDIAAAPSPRRSGESFDLDSVVDNIFTDGDRDFMKRISDLSSARPTKRARTYSRKQSILREPSLNANVVKAPKTVKVAIAKEADCSEVPTSSRDSTLATEGQPPTGITEQASSTPDTPASVRRREAEGAKAALAARKLVASRKVAPLTISKKDRKSSATLRKSTRNRVAGPVKGNSEQPEPNPQQAVTNVDCLVTSPLTSSNVHDPRPSDSDATADESSLSSKVLTLFKDGKLCYYPATYLETIVSEGEKFRVKFYDGTVAIVDPTQARRFELRINDCVKIDMNGMRKGTYLIQGFADGAGSVTPKPVFSDALGHKVVKVVPKTTEDVTASQEPIIVPVQFIYLTGGMLPNFADRRFTPLAKAPDRFSTPALQVSEPATPGSRSRRQTYGTSVHGTDLPTNLGSGLFSNMLFAVTFFNDNDQSKHKDTVVKQIGSNGGRVLDHGFDKIFEPDVSHAASPKKLPSHSTTAIDASKKPLRLQLGTQCLGFTAVIADRHCRKEKYLQALALGIPCLHHRWITDCVTQATVLPFERYLLPAGESEFLSGAVHSRILAPYDPSSDQATLQGVLDRRPLPLRDATVLLAMSSADRRKAYRFLAYAAGASSVRCVHNVTEAKKALDGIFTCDWVLCDGDKVKVKDTLLATKQEMKKKRKRKRDSDMLPSAPLKDIKVADTEFLVQSLILGALADL